MSTPETNTPTSGIGFAGLLTIVFITLKLIPYKDHHMIDWSWWWVLSPLWISLALILVLASVAALIYFVLTRHERR